MSDPVALATAVSALGTEVFKFMNAKQKEKFMKMHKESLDALEAAKSLRAPDYTDYDVNAAEIEYEQLILAYAKELSNVAPRSSA